MEINKEMVYTIKEVSQLLNEHPRKLNRIAVKHNLKKIDNRYIFDGSFLIDYFNLTDVKTMSKDVETMSKDVKGLHREIEDLKEQLEQYEVGENERIEVFSNEDYEVFQNRLLEWFQLQKEIENQQEKFDIEKKTNAELLTHYQNQFEYQKNQSTRILEMHERLIETIQLQAKNTTQRNIIEAKDKEIIDNNWKHKT